MQYDSLLMPLITNGPILMSLRWPESLVGYLKVGSLDYVHILMEVIEDPRSNPWFCWIRNTILELIFLGTDSREFHSAEAKCPPPDRVIILSQRIKLAADQPWLCAQGTSSWWKGIPRRSN